MDMILSEIQSELMHYFIDHEYTTRLQCVLIVVPVILSIVSVWLLEEKFHNNVYVYCVIQVDLTVDDCRFCD